MITQRHNKEYKLYINYWQKIEFITKPTPLGKGCFHTKKSTILSYNIFNWAFKKYFGTLKGTERTTK